MNTTVYAPAKLTLSLRIVGSRQDGYHLIDAEMVTLDLYDTLEINSGGSGLQVLGGGPDVPTGETNLVNQALLMAARTAAVVLTKRIPSQAGLGGGSSDAAAVLRWAGFDDLAKAARLGADVAFCLVGGRARVTGIGEIVQPLPFEERTITLMTPPLSCQTPAVYQAWDELGGPRNEAGENDLEPAAIRVAPQLEVWRDELWADTGQRPTLAGSGSTWFVSGAHPGPGRVITKTTPAGWHPSQ